MSRANTTAAGQYQPAQLFSDDIALSHLVGDFLATGFAGGDAGVVIATPEHRLLIEAELRARAINVDGLKKMGELVALDARDMLNTFIVDGLPHAATFSDVLGRVLGQVCRSHPNCTIRIYSEMVNVLGQDGLEAAAIRLATLWNGLVHPRDVQLLGG